MIVKLNNEIKSLLLLNNRVKGFLALMLVSVFFSSCDESSVIGLAIQPTNDLLGFSYIDTTTVVTRTIKMDSLASDEYSPLLQSTHNLQLGTYLDPTFGLVSNSIYTQLSLTTNNPDFGAGAGVDSVVLSLAYNPSFYGKTFMAPQTVNVYRLTGDISTSTRYYSVDTIAADNSLDLAGGYQFKPAPIDSVTIIQGGVPAVLKPQIRIPLNASLGTELLLNQSLLVSSSSLQTFMKGLYITTKNSSLSLLNGTGNLFYIMMADPQTRLTVYYHNGSGTGLSYDFSLAGKGRFSRFEHDYSYASNDLQNQLSAASGNNDLVYIQGAAGLKVKVDFPYLMGWLKDGPIAINKAELVVKIDQDAVYQKDTFAVPGNIVVFGVYADSTNFILPASSGDPGFGGTYNSSTQDYHFNISRYIQQVLTGKIQNTGLHLVVANGVYYSNRVVVGGGAATSPYQMKLNISYTKL